MKLASAPESMNTDIDCGPMGISSLAWMSGQVGEKQSSQLTSILLVTAEP